LANDAWRRIATTPGTQFDIEGVAVIGENATIRWKAVPCAA
jgi:hypothetical protein